MRPPPSNPPEPVSVYAGQAIALTTLHGKERALSRPLALGLGASLTVCPCDTNALGTFSGEVEWPGDALSCGLPGWGLVDTEPGRACQSCGTATELTAAEVWGCPACGLRQRRPRRDGLAAADPGQCPWCNR